MRSYVEILKQLDHIEEERQRTQTAYQREQERSEAFERATKLAVQEGTLEVLEALIQSPEAISEVLPELNKVRESAGLETITLVEDTNGI